MVLNVALRYRRYGRKKDNMENMLGFKMLILEFTALDSKYRGSMVVFQELFKFGINDTKDVMTNFGGKFSQITFH